MKKYYQEVIQKNLTNLRNALLTAICYYLEQDEKLNNIVLGNETLTDIEPAFNEREHIVTRNTTVTFEVYDNDGQTHEEARKLNGLSIEWLIAIYEEISHNKLKM